jgi:hypothetical protein
MSNKHFRKLEAKKFNEMKVSTGLDPKKFEWKDSHKKCSGRGFIGYAGSDQRPVLCSCVKPIAQSPV